MEEKDLETILRLFTSPARPLLQTLVDHGHLLGAQWTNCILYAAHIWDRHSESLPMKTGPGANRTSLCARAVLLAQSHVQI